METSSSLLYSLQPTLIIDFKIWLPGRSWESKMFSFWGFRSGDGDSLLLQNDSTSYHSRIEYSKDSDVNISANSVGSLCASLHKKYLSFPYVLHKVSLSSNIYSKFSYFHTFIHTYTHNMLAWKYSKVYHAHSCQMKERPHVKQQ